MPYRYNAITGEFDLVMDGGALGAITEIDMDTGTVTPVAGVVNLNGENGISTSGSSNNGTITSTGFSTPFVVSQDSDTDFSTIQDALDAANSAGGAVIVVRPGTYTENLTLYDSCHIMGLNFADAGGGVVINGVHTPPDSGGFAFNYVQLESATDIFNSNSAGSTHLIIGNASIIVTNGYTFNVPNWTGKLETYDVNDRGSTNDGYINNSGGSEVAIFSAAVGAGTGNDMTVSGSVSIFTCAVGCPINFASGSSSFMEYNLHLGTLTFDGNSTGEFIGCELDTNIVMSSTADWLISQCVVNNATNPVIDGSGSGTITLNDISFISNDSISGTLTLGNSSFYPRRMSNGQLLIGEAGQPPRAANLSSTGGTVSITNGSGSINLEAGTTTPTQFDTDSGSATPAANILNVLGGTLLGSTGSGNTVTLNADDNVVGSVSTDGSSATPTSNAFTIAGGTGITTSGAGATVTVDLDAPVTVANGGTGATTLTGILTGNGTGAITANEVTQYTVLLGGASNAVSEVSGVGTSGQVLTSNGAAMDPTWQDAATGVTGPGSSTDNALARWNGTGGDTLQDSSVIVSDAGEMTNALQPAFLAYLATTDADVTGNNTSFLLGDTDVGTAFTTVFDQTSDFTTGSASGCSYAAPITGRYNLHLAIGATGFSTSPNTNHFQIITSNRVYEVFNTSTLTTGSLNYKIDVLADMDAADTATYLVAIDGQGVDDIDILGAADMRTMVSGSLIC